MATANSASVANAANAGMIQIQKNVADMDMWLRIARSKNLRFDGDSENWIIFAKDIKFLMEAVSPKADRIMQTVEKVKPNEIAMKHYADIDANGDIVKNQQTGEPLVLAETRQLARQVPYLLSCTAQASAAMAILDQEDEDGFKSYC